jgi:8-oxo-dGTP pyrophosphatase MutT (NUDIX family)
MSGVKCVLTRGDRVLLVRHTYGRSEWDLPGGSIKRHEPPVDAARREMHEELGIQIEHWTALGEIFASTHHRHDTLYCFQAELPAIALEIDYGELAAVEWFPRASLPSELGRYVSTILTRST